MSSYEVMSVVALCVSVVAPICGFLVPIILNHINARRERKEKEREFLFEEQYAIFEKFSTAYSEWRIDSNKKDVLLQTIFDITIVCDCWHPKTVAEFNALISNHSTETETDEKFFRMLNELKQYFGVWYDNQRELLPAKLRRNIRNKSKF